MPFWHDWHFPFSNDAVCLLSAHSVGSVFLPVVKAYDRHWMGRVSNKNLQILLALCKEILDVLCPTICWNAIWALHGIWIVKRTGLNIMYATDRWQILVPRLTGWTASWYRLAIYNTCTLRNIMRLDNFQWQQGTKYEDFRYAKLCSLLWDCFLALGST
jgi:hypothetical protein